VRSVERAAIVALLEQRLEGGQNWDAMFARIIDETCDPALRIALRADPDLYDELELQTFEELAGALELV
jgi:hypothetical protein